MNKIIPLVIAGLSISIQAFSCTGISLFTSARDLIQGRTIEWAEYDLESKLVLSPAGHTYTSVMPDSTAGLTWTAKYGFAGISVNKNIYIGEGVNEKGLSAGIFYFKGFGSLDEYNSNERSKSVTDIDFVRWILTNFSSVDEMLARLNTIKLTPVYIDMNGIHSPTGHWRVSDKSGRNVIIEIINNGEIKIFNNIGVLTNSPGYEWQLTNLSNYLNIGPGTIPSKEFGFYKAKALGAGTGSLGLPGDITPPSRFIRAAYYLSCNPVYDLPENAVQSAFHILSNFDIPIGSEFTLDQHSHIPAIPSATQWTSVIDHTNLLFYYRTMFDARVRRVKVTESLKNLKSEKYLPLDEGKFTVTDVNV